MKWTDEQREAISARGSDILVSAAAGSGKTAVLTERIKQMILTDGISIDEMLVVTFSNAAAAEMKEKILKSISQEIRALNDMLNSGSLTAGESAQTRKKAGFLRKQLRKAHTADISTFHKFSMNIIRRYFYLIDAEADFSICDEARRQILQGEALDELFEERFAEEEAGFIDFLRKYSGVRSEKTVREMILSVYRFIMSMPEPFSWLESACSALGADMSAFRQSEVFRYISGAMRASAAEALRLAESVYDMVAHLPSLESKAKADLEQIGAVCEALKGDFDAAEIAKQINSLKYARFTAAKDDKADYEQIKDLVKDLRDNMKKKLGGLSGEFFSIPVDEALARMNETQAPAEYLCGLVRDFHERFTAKKQEKSLVDFNDIEHLALQILDHEEAAADYRNHFRVIFVDEYQDSSILQETLIQKISRGNNVYMVGDVKQSIYKFRLAEPEIFIGKYNSFAPKPAGEGIDANGKQQTEADQKAGSELKEEARSEKELRTQALPTGGGRQNVPQNEGAQAGEASGRRIDLNRNFRCKGNIVCCVNGIFSHVMDREHGGIEYDENAALKKGVTYEGELDRPVTLHLIDSTKNGDDEYDGELDEEIAELEKTELEARVTAKLAAERLGQKIYDSKAEAVRTVGFGDIVILLRGTKGTADIYAQALREQGIPSYIDAGEGYFETMEIEVFMNLLRVIDNRRRDIPLISVLRSPIFGFTVNELIDIRLCHREGSYSEAFLSSETEKCLSAREKLDEWRLKAKYMPLEEFLWMLMRESGYIEYASALPGGDRRAANLRALVDKAVAYAGSQNKGLFGFVRYVELLNENRVSIGQSSQQNGAENAVRIMTIHKSKGLEFPVVILGGLGRQFNRDRNTSSVILQKDLGLGLRYADPDRNCFAKTVVQRVIERKKAEERLAEEMRILYVALTRAMDELVLVGSMNKLQKELENFSVGLRGAAGTPKCFLDWIIPNMEAAGIQTVLYDRRTLSDHLSEEYKAADQLRGELLDGFSNEKQANELFERISERFSFRYPYEDDVFSKSKFTVSELNRVIRGTEAPDGWSLPTGRDDEISVRPAEPLQEDPEEERKYVVSEESCAEAIPAFLRDEAEITPAMRGTFMHKVMELIPLRENTREKDVEEFVASLVEKNVLTSQEAETVSVRQIASFFRTETGKRACHAHWVKREWPFTLRRSREELAAMAKDPETAAKLRRELPSELLIQGIIDCCFGDDDGIVVVDYKTDYIDFKDKEVSYNEIRRRYEKQVALYRDVIRIAFDTDKIEAKLFLFRASEVIDL